MNEMLWSQGSHLVEPQRVGGGDTSLRVVGARQDNQRGRICSFFRDERKPKKKAFQVERTAQNTHKDSKSVSPQEAADSSGCHRLGSTRVGSWGQGWPTRQGPVLVTALHVMLRNAEVCQPGQDFSRAWPGQKFRLAHQAARGD